jgi:putative ABC transport system substrate-binding protein
MRRQEFIIFLGCALLCPCVALAQQSAKPKKIGWLVPSPGPEKNLRAFLRGLEELGYVEGRDIAIERRNADLNFDRLPSLAAELVERKVDVIVTVATQAAIAAHKATSVIPIVAISVTDPVGRGLAELDLEGTRPV